MSLSDAVTMSSHHHVHFVITNWRKLKDKI